MRCTRLAALLVIGAGLWTACSDSSRDLLGPSAATPALTRITPDFRAALAAQKRHTPALLRVPGIVGTAIGLAPDGKPTVRLLLAQPNVTAEVYMQAIPESVRRAVESLDRLLIAGHPDQTSK